MKFKVVYEPDGGGWHAEIFEVRGCHTWGRSLAAARRHIREALSTCADVLGADADRIAKEAELVEEFELPVEMRRALNEYRKAQAAMDSLSLAVTKTGHAVAVKMLKSQISLRDAGDLLGVSHQQINRLLATGQRKAAKPSKSRRSHAA